MFVSKDIKLQIPVSSVTAAIKTSDPELSTANVSTNPRNKRFGKTKRGKRNHQRGARHMNATYFRAMFDPPTSEPLGLDVEFVRDLKTNKLLPGWVAICQDVHRGESRRSKIGDACVYHTKVYHRINEIDLMTRYSGITEDMVRHGREISKVRLEVIHYLENYTIVGANIKQDLASLDLMCYRHKTFDIQYDNCFHGRGGQNDAIKLRTLAYSLADKKIQEYDLRPQMRGRHSPLIDARTAVMLYKRLKKGYYEGKVDNETRIECYQWCREKELENDQIRDVIEKERQAKARRKHFKYMWKNNI